MALTPIQFLISPSVTVTAGSNVINVTGSVDCSKVYSGTAVFIGNSQVAEAVSGTIPDGSGNSTITLRYNWPSVTTTSRMVAFNSIEGLTEAIRRAREVIENIDGADAQIQGQLEAINDNLVLIGDAPTYAAATAADAAQTALDRIATGEDASATAADAAQTALDRIATGEDAAATTADAAQTALDRIATGEDAAQTALDRIATGEDAAATALDRIATGEDAAATNADVAITNADVVLTHADVVTTNNNVTLTEGARDIALANANYKGYWSDQTGAATPPYAVRDADTIYMLNVPLADVTTSQPSLNPTEWFILGSITGVSPDSLKLGGKLAAVYFNETDNLPTIAEVDGLTAVLEAHDKRIKFNRLLAMAGL